MPNRLGWNDCTLVALPGAKDELAGFLCLSGPVSSTEDRVFLESMAGHAAMALQNSQLFTRIEQANRHSIEIFDAITDFIVVHDQPTSRARESLSGCDDRRRTEGIDRCEHARADGPDQRCRILFVPILPLQRRRRR